MEYIVYLTGKYIKIDFNIYIQNATNLCILLLSGEK